MRDGARSIGGGRHSCISQVSDRADDRQRECELVASTQRHARRRRYGSSRLPMSGRFLATTPSRHLQAIQGRRTFEGRSALSRYNAVVGVADVSLEVRRGEIFCVMGLSGSGKSTLVRHFNRLVGTHGRRHPDRGRRRHGLGSLSELRAFRNRKIGMVFQNFALLPHWSVLDNIAMPLAIRVRQQERAHADRPSSILLPGRA